MNLAELLQRSEDKTLEFKRDLSNPDGVLRTIVAFANTAGGTVLIGIEDKTRHVRGIRDPLATEERLANLISDNIAPRLVPNVEILPWRKIHVLAVQVYPSPTRPHYIKRDGVDAGVYVRIGSTNRRADPALIDELRRFSRGESYDEQALPELDSDALDFRAASASFAPVRALRRADLETLRLITTHQGRKVPTIGGVLLFGKDRERYFPDAWIQAGRFRGIDKTHISDSVEFRRYPVEAVDDAIAFIKKHALHGIEVGSVRRQERWNFPPAAVREAVINAVAHADYAQRGAPLRISIFDDRLEIENPGLLPFSLTLDDIQQGVSKLRNRVIGRVFHDLGLIEQWGSGIARMRSACLQAGLPMPVLEEIGTRFRVTLFNTAATAPNVDELDQAILNALSVKNGLSTQEIAATIQRSPRATRTRLLRLLQNGLIKEIGTGPHDPKRRYFR